MKRALLALLAVAPAFAAEDGQDAFAAGEAARQAGRFADALRHAADVAEPAARARLELNTRYWAGDLGGALRTGLRGLEAAPDDAWLLYYTSLLALDVGALEPAEDCVPRLAAAARAPGLDAASADFYAERAIAFSADLADARSARAARDAGTRRARWTVWIGACAALLGFAALMRAAPSAEAEEAT